MTYAKVGGGWKIRTLDYHSGFGAPYTTGWVPPEPRQRGGAPRGPRNLPHPRTVGATKRAAASRPRAPARSLHETRRDGRWATSGPPSRCLVRTGRRPVPCDRAADLARARSISRTSSHRDLQKIYGDHPRPPMWRRGRGHPRRDGTTEMAQRGVYVGKPRAPIPEPARSRGIERRRADD